MTRGERGVIFGTVALALVLLVVDAIAPHEPNWRETFSAYKRDPFGCELVYERLPDLFHHGVTIVHDPIYLTAQERLAQSDTAGPMVHLFIGPQHTFDELDVRHLLKMVERGDNAFIAASQWEVQNLMDTLGIAMEYHYSQPKMVWKNGRMTWESRDTSTLVFTCAPLNQGPGYHLYRGDLGNFITSFRIDSTQVLAMDQRQQVVLLRMPWGKGMIYVCSLPQAFSNYALMRDESRGFMESAFSLLPDRPVLWDEFYKVGRMEQATPLRFVLSRTALKAAYWTAVVLLLLTIFVYARRRQRAIPVVEPPRNTSREFAETMGRLYFFKGDHTDMARKLCAYFKEDVREKLYLRRAVWDEETIAHIARRTGQPEARWAAAFRLIKHYEGAPYASEEQLMQLNKTLSDLRQYL